MMNINLLRRFSIIVRHFERISEAGNPKFLLELLKTNPQLQLITTSTKKVDASLRKQTVSLAHLALGLADNKPTVIDHRVVVQLLTGAQKLISDLTTEVMRLNGGVISANLNSPSYSPLMSYIRVKADGRYIDNAIYVNIPEGNVVAYKVNGKGEVILDEEEKPIPVQIYAKEVYVHFTLD
jgi:hypothetical protein